MPREKGPPSMVVRLPVEVVTELRRKAERRGMSVGDLLREALKLGG